MRIACRGGPGGLLAALLAKRSHPGREVTVFERNRAGDTFGFGVVFSDATLDGIDAADPVLRAAPWTGTASTGTRSRCGCAVSAGGSAATAWPR